MSFEFSQESYLLDHLDTVSFDAVLAVHGNRYWEERSTLQGRYETASKALICDLSEKIDSSQKATLLDFWNYFNSIAPKVCGVLHELNLDKGKPGQPLECPIGSANPACLHTFDFMWTSALAPNVLSGEGRDSWAMVAFVLGAFLRQRGYNVPVRIDEVFSQDLSYDYTMQDSKVAMSLEEEPYPPVPEKKSGVLNLLLSGAIRGKNNDKNLLTGKQTEDIDLVIREAMNFQDDMSQEIMERYIKPIRLAFADFLTKQVVPIQANTKTGVRLILEPEFVGVSIEPEPSIQINDGEVLLAA